MPINVAPNTFMPSSIPPVGAGYTSGPSYTRSAVAGAAAAAPGGPQAALIGAGSGLVQAAIGGKGANRANATQAAADAAQMAFLREQWDYQKKQDEKDKAEKKLQYEAEQKQSAPYRGVSRGILQQQADRLGISVPEDDYSGYNRPSEPPPGWSQKPSLNAIVPETVSSPYSARTLGDLAGVASANPSVARLDDPNLQQMTLGQILQLYKGKQYDPRRMA